MSTFFGPMRSFHFPTLATVVVGSFLCAESSLAARALPAPQPQNAARSALRLEYMMARLRDEGALLPPGKTGAELATLDLASALIRFDDEGRAILEFDPDWSDDGDAGMRSGPRCDLLYEPVPDSNPPRMRPVCVTPPNCPAGQQCTFKMERVGNRYRPSCPCIANTPCDCYFNRDCQGSATCNYGPKGSRTEDNCQWRQPKPSGPGTGCQEDHPDTYSSDICDGLCTTSLNGSVFGFEDPLMVQDCLRAWMRAILIPARDGGGPMDPDSVAEALAFSFFSQMTNDTLGRHIGSLSVIVCGDHFIEHPEGPHAWWEHLVGDLSDDPCSAMAIELLSEALIAEILVPGSGIEFVAQIPEFCEDGEDVRFSVPCDQPGALACAYGRVLDSANFLRRPPRIPGHAGH